MNAYFSLALAVLCLYQPIAGDALNIYNATKAESSESLKSRIKHLAQAFDPQLGVGKDLESQVTLTGFVEAANAVLAPLPFVTRDNLAQLILFTEGLYGSLRDMTSVFNLILSFANIILSLYPFGALVPILMQIVLNVVMNERTKFYVQYLMFRVWSSLPATGLEKLEVKVIGQRVIVVPAGPPTPVLTSSPTPELTTLPPA